MALYIWFAFMIFLLVVIGIFWNILDYGWDLNTAFGSSALNVSADPIASNGSYTAGILNTIWKYLPIVLLIFMFVWMLVVAQKKQEEF